MAKWFSFLAFLIAAGAAYLLMESQKNVETMQTKGEALSKDLDSTKTTLGKTKTELEGTKKTLETTTADLTTTRADLATAKADADKAKSDYKSVIDQLVAAGVGTPEDLAKGLSALKEKIQKLTDDNKASEEKIAAATKEKEEAVAKAAEAQKKFDEQSLIVTQLTQDNESKGKEVTKQTAKVNKYEKEIMVKGTRGRVLAVNSGWGFAVVSIGDKQGAAPNKTLVVARGGQGIGKLRISNIESNQSIADIVPGSFVPGTIVQPGDDVIFTGDEKVKAEADAPAAGAVLAPPLPR